MLWREGSVRALGISGCTAAVAHQQVLLRGGGRRVRLHVGAQLLEAPQQVARRLGGLRRLGREGHPRLGACGGRGACQTLHPNTQLSHVVVARRCCRVQRGACFLSHTVKDDSDHRIRITTASEEHYCYEPVIPEFCPTAAEFRGLKYTAQKPSVDRAEKGNACSEPGGCDANARALHPTSVQQAHRRAAWVAWPPRPAAYRQRAAGAATLAPAPGRPPPPGTPAAPAASQAATRGRPRSFGLSSFRLNRAAFVCRALGFKTSAGAVRSHGPAKDEFVSPHNLKSNSGT